MISRRVLVGGAVVAGVAGVGTARALGVDDDALRALGARPHPEPAPGDVGLLAAARREQTALVDALAELAEGEPAAEPLAAVAREQLHAVGGAAGGAPPAPRETAPLVQHTAALADARASDALVALSPDLATVLAAHAAGLAQVARALEELT